MTVSYQETHSYHLGMAHAVAYTRTAKLMLHAPVLVHGINIALHDESSLIV